MAKSILRRAHEVFRHAEPYLALLVAGGFFTWLAKEGRVLGVDTWQEALFLGVGAACFLMLSLAAILAGYRYFYPLPAAPSNDGSTLPVLDHAAGIDPVKEWEEFRDQLHHRLTTLEALTRNTSNTAQDVVDSQAEMNAAFEGRLAKLEQRTDVVEAERPHRLTDIDRERCSATLRDVHDFIGGELTPFISDIHGANRLLPEGFLNLLPSFQSKHVELIEQANHLWHRHAHYLDLMSFDIMPILQALEAMRNPIAEGVKAKDWPQDAQREKVEHVVRSLGGLSEAINTVRNTLPVKRREFIDG